MAREFTVSMNNQTVGAAITLIGYLPIAAPNVLIRNLRYWVSQYGSVTSAMIPVQLVNQPSVYPTMASPSVIAPAKKSDTTASVLTGAGAATLTAGKIGVTATAEGAGTKVPYHSDSFNNQNGWLSVPTPDEVEEYPASFASSFGLYLPVAPTSTTNWQFGLKYGER